MSLLEFTDTTAWLERKAGLRHRLSTIVIPLDITPGVAKGLLSRIDAFFSEVRLELAELEGRKEQVDAIIREWERSNATGSNETERKRNATDSLQNYRLSESQTINMYEVYRLVYERWVFMKGIVDVLEGKQSRLITVGGLLKLEKDLSPHASID
jgi:hypothetical protein